jgi:hypothetical protein
MAAWSITVAVLSVVAQLWVCPRWGAVGAAAVLAVTELLIAIGVLTLAAREMAVPLPLGRLSATIGTGVATVVAALLLDWSPVVEAVLAGVIFAGVVVAARVLTMQDLRRVLSRKELGAGPGVTTPDPV